MLQLRLIDLQFLFRFNDFVSLNDVADFNVIEILDGNTAFHTGAHFLYIVFDAFERGDFCRLAFFGRISHDAVPDKANGRVAQNFALRHLATGNSTHFCDFEHLLDVHAADDFFLACGLEHALNGHFDFLNGLVNDGVQLDFHTFALSQLSGSCAGAYLEADDDGIRSRGQQNIGLCDGAHGFVYHIDFDRLDRKFDQRI